MTGFRRWPTLALTAAAFAIVAACFAPSATAADPAADMIARGRVLVAFGSCNDCHTPGWRESDGNLPVSQWMIGVPIGFRGPWGTIYPTNVRLRFQQMSESEWLHAVETRGGHPPMKWTDLRVLSITDRKAIYRFIRSLGPAGVPAPNDVPPDKEPTTPFINVVPQKAG
jgi:mono/diheme cytochrome c family protein